MIGFGSVSGALYTFDFDRSRNCSDAFDEAVYPGGPTFSVNYRALACKIFSMEMEEVGMTGGFVEECFR